MIDNAEIGKNAAVLARQHALNAAEKQGLTLDHIMKRLKEATDATTVREFAYEGNIIKGEVMADSKVRLQAVKIAMEFFESMPNPKLILGGNVNVMPIISDEDRELMMKFVEMEKGEFIRKHQAAIRSELTGGSESD